ncbi:MAG: NAD(P)/FAD-dependent oxidoreductase, partial [Chitinophagales bacterium]
YMGHMKFEHTQPYENWFWEKNRIKLVRAYVQKIDTDKKQLILSSNYNISYDKLLIASGAKSNKFGWPGQDLKGVQGLYSYQDLMELEENTRNGINRAVIVGGGLIGIELAEMLHSRHYPVTFLVRESNYWNNVLPEQESTMISRHIREHGFELRLNEHLKEIVGDEHGRVEAVITSNGDRINCQLVGLTAGVSPNVEFVKGGSINVDRGVVINGHMETSVDEIYAAGDCAQFQHGAKHDRRIIEQVWYTGKLQGECAALNMIGERTLYHPGYWFNSAKFLDIEYQTYGTVMPKLRDGEVEFYWEHEDGKKCVHIIYRKEDRLFIGINVFGIRMRHAVFNQWLQEKKSVDYILENLNAANFDPEFFAAQEKAIIQKWNAENKNHPVRLQNISSHKKLIFK